ncbi:MAG: methylisocitrate lyase [Acidobacteria bacterium]|nr:methylisocitrate lyase [Acidobacteriota bacterium]
MLSTTRSAHDRRRDLRDALASGQLVQMPGAFTPLSARLIERAGFPGVYVSGAVMSAELGLPDIGLTTLTEVATRAGQIARTTDLPVLVDADTGFGEPLNVARTIQALEDAGVAGLHLEDQVNPKRCGHLDGKSVVDVTSAARRIASAVRARRDPDLLVVARSDALAVEGFDRMLDRLRAYVDAGADAVFPEAVTSLADYERVRQALDVPVLANMTEFGKSELFSASDLASAGVSIVIYPVSLMRLSMGIIERALTTLHHEGSLASLVPEMQTRARLYEVLDYAAYGDYDDGIFTFRLPGDEPAE